MKDEDKSKEHLTSELEEARRRVAEVSETEAQGKRADEILRTIVEGTASATGDDFFRSLVRNLATALQVRYAFASEFAHGNTRVRTLAFWTGDNFIDNFEYNLDGTPCEQVLRGETRHYPKGVQSLFPKDKDLVKLGAESYLAIPLIDPSGNVLGHLAVIDDKPMPSETRDISILKIFVARAGAELERKRVEEALRESEERISRILESAMDAIVTVDDKQRITLFNSATEAMFRCPTTEAIGRPLDRFLSEGFLKVLTDHIQALKQGTETKPYMWIPEGLTALRADGEEFPIEGTISQVEVAGQKLYTVILRDINERKKAEEELRKLRLENVYLQEEIKTEYNFGEIVGSSTAIKRVFRNIEQVAGTDSTVLVLGETGTGKELIARAVHNLSLRKDKALVKVNCAALPSGLVESELFGHEKGSFTGALLRKIGRFELANGGTIFLDEIGDLPLELQAKLLRVLQEGELERVGGSGTIRVDVRVIAATNRDLEKAMQESRFRQDLFYRLNVFPIHLPSLREREKDIPLLVKYFATKYGTKLGRKIETIPQKTMDSLLAYTWPGNVRELENVIERSVILSPGPQLELGEWLPRPDVGPSETRVPTLEELEREHIIEVLEIAGWRVSGEKGAAKLLGVKPTTLESRIKKLGIIKKR